MLYHNGIVQEGDQEYQDAVELWDFYQKTREDLMSAATNDESTANTKNADPATQAKCKQLLDSVMKLKNGDRLLCEFFIKLPDKKVSCSIISLVELS